jgi:hypothetical protein
MSKMVTHSYILYAILDLLNVHTNKVKTGQDCLNQLDVYQHCICLIRGHCSIVTVQVN